MIQNYFCPFELCKNQQNCEGGGGSTEAWGRFRPVTTQRRWGSICSWRWSHTTTPAVCGTSICQLWPVWSMDKFTSKSENKTESSENVDANSLQFFAPMKRKSASLLLVVRINTDKSVDQSMCLFCVSEQNAAVHQTTNDSLSIKHNSCNVSPSNADHPISHGYLKKNVFQWGVTRSNSPKCCPNVWKTVVWYLMICKRTCRIWRIASSANAWEQSISNSVCSQELNFHSLHSTQRKIRQVSVVT